jgi:DNA repair exonuclease SbcCD nuclease subunit
MIAMITDTHWGVRNNSTVFLDMMSRYYDEVLFPALKRDNITILIHGGDIVDNRSAANYRMLRHMKESFFDNLVKYGIDLHIIPGNHDIFFRNDVYINAIRELYDGHPNVNVYDKPSESVFDGSSFLMLPWISPNNYDDCMKAIEDSTADYCVGHLEIAGAKMYKNSTSEHGMSSSTFNKFKRTFSGHYHHASDIGKISYIGSLFHTTWQCYNDYRGYITFDTASNKITTHANDSCIFTRVVYDDRVEVDLDRMIDGLCGKIVEVVVNHKQNVNLFNKFRSMLDDIPTVDINIVERHLLQKLDIKQTQQIIDDAQNDSPVDIVLKYLAETSNADKKILGSELKEIYHRAVDLMHEGE